MLNGMNHPIVANQSAFIDKPGNTSEQHIM